MSYDPDNEYDQDNPALEKDTCNVFIKYLPPELTDTGLYTLFAPYGEIESCKVMVDPVTGHSLGYGFCRYMQSEYAEAAIQKMTGQKIANKTLLCKLSNSSSANNAEPSDNLYIKPLLATTSTDELRMLFEKFGPIKECKVMVDKNTGMSRQLGFVRFQNKEDAIRALKETNGYILQPNTPPIVVKFAESDKAKVQRRAKLLINQSAAAARQMAAYIYQMQQQQAMWSQAAYSMMPPSPGAESAPQSAMPYVLADSYGNVTIAPSSSEVSSTSPPTTAPDAAPGSVSPASSNSPPPYGAMSPWEMPMWPAYGPAYPPRHRRGRRGPLTGTNLFVFHLPPSIDDQGLWRLFSPFGQLDSVKVICDRTMHKSKGYGFVKYIRLADAMTAVAAMNGFPLENKHLKVTFKQHYLHMRRNRRRFDPSRYYHTNFQGDQDQEYEIGEGEEIDDEDVEEDDEDTGEDQQDEDEESEDNELETEEQQPYRSHGRGYHHYNQYNPYHNNYHGHHRSHGHRRYRDYSHSNSPAHHERTYTAEDLKAQPYLAAVIGTRNNNTNTEQQTPAAAGQSNTNTTVSTESNTNQPPQQQSYPNPYPYNKHRRGQYNGQRGYQNGYKSHQSGHPNPYHYPAYTGKKTTKYRSHEAAPTTDVVTEVDKITTQVGQMSVADEAH